MAAPAAALVGVGILLLLALGRKRGRGPEPLRPQDTGLPPGRAEKPQRVTKQIQQILALVEDYKLPAGYEAPEEFSAASLWVAPDCGAWILGKQFKAQTLLAKPFIDGLFAAAAADRPDLLKRPPSTWSAVAWNAGEKPTWPSPSVPFVKAALEDLYGGAYVACAQGVPEPSDFSSEENWLQAWTAFSQEKPVLYALIYNLATWSRDFFDAEWETQYPDEADEFWERKWAQDSLAQADNTEDRTDWAYHHAFPDCPEVIDPNNPQHAECMQAWLRIRGYVQEYGG
jgi:hypothetical protein